jgi:membrane peptidoglycan carboxypeptidase
MGNGKKIPDIYPAFVLGGISAGFSTLDTAGAYATMAAHGLYCAPIAITKVTDHNHKDVHVPGADCHEAVDPGLADTVTSILHGVLTLPRATAVGVGEPGRPAAAKTGTAENYSASDFAGYVPQMAAAVWVGNPHRPNSSLAGVSIGGRTYGRVYGATIAGPIWRETMRAALEGVPVEPLPQPDPRYVNGVTKTVPDVSGLSVSDAKSVLRRAGFIPFDYVRSVPSLLPAGTIAYTSPGAGAAVPPGSTIYLRVSDGTPPPPPPAPAAHPQPQPSKPSSPAPAKSPPGHKKKHGHGHG